jgi:predicted nucleotidyltransferase
MVRLSRTFNKIDLRGKIPQLIQYFTSKRNILAVYLYGSYGTEYQTPLSDVDLALLFIAGTKITFEEQLNLAGDISDIVQEDDVNLLFLNEVPVTMQFEVLLTGRLIFKRDHDQVCDFVEQVLKRYGDYQIDLREFYREYDESLREEYLGG